MHWVEKKKKKKKKVSKTEKKTDALRMKLF